MKDWICLCVVGLFFLILISSSAAVALESASKIEIIEDGVLIYPVLSINSKPIGELVKGSFAEVLEKKDISGVTWILIQPKEATGLRRGWLPYSKKVRIFEASGAVFTPIPQEINKPVENQDQEQAETILVQKEPEWNMKFSDQERLQLEQYGCEFEEIDMDISNILFKRGFSSHKFIEAYRIWHRLPMATKDEIPTIATIQFLNLPLSQYLEYRKHYNGLDHYYSNRQSGPVTDFCNYRIGGKVLGDVGAVLIGGGTVLIIAGGVVWAISGSCYQTDGNSDGSCLRMEVGGILGMGVGVSALATGLGIGIPGFMKMERWLPKNTLDGRTQEYLKHYINSQEYSENRSTTNNNNSSDQVSYTYAIGLFPYLTTDSKGIFVLFNF